MDDVKKDRRGGSRPGAGRKTIPMVQRRLQRRISCTQEELDWLEEVLDKRRAERGEKLRSKRNDSRKRRIE